MMEAKNLRWGAGRARKETNNQSRRRRIRIARN